MIAENTKRTNRVQKICPFCDCEFLGEKDDGERFCEEHRGAGR